MAINVDVSQIQKFMESKEGRLILGWLIGKNDKQIKAYLAKQAELIKAGEATTKSVMKTSAIKTVALLAAIYIARQEGTRAWKEAEKVMNKEDLTGFQKLGRAALELWPPTMTVRSFKAAWDYLTTKQSNNKAKQQSPEMMNAKEQSKKALYGISDSQVKEKSEAAKSRVDEKAEDLGMVKRPTNPTAQVEWAKEVERRSANKTASTLDSKNKLAQAATDKKAEELGMSKRPTNLTAQTEWAKEVERMSKIRKNDPNWYYRGKADKLIVGTLTWSSVKSNTKGAPLVGFCTFNTALVFPLIDSKLPVKVATNYEALFSALRGPNTGAYSYAVKDVFNYTVAIYGLIAKIKYVMKVIKAAHTHDVEQDNLAKIATSMLAGNNANAYNEIITNGPNLVSRLNSLCEEINKWPLIGTSWLSRWNYLADKCLKDYNGPKAIYGAYAIKSAYKWDKATASFKSTRYFSSTTSTTPVSDVISALEAEYDDFRTTPASTGDVNGMLKVAGDMIKLLGTDKNVFSNIEYLDQVRPGK